LILLPVEKMNPWGKPKTLPAGARDYVLSGNPGKPELYTFRFELPAHYKIPPFLLKSTSYVTVISGELYVGEGNKFIRTSQQILSAGSYMVIPANVPLYFETDKKTILQFHGIGPIDVDYISEQDDPRSKH
jgi:quercetin dioxygenase-like cupin family protein